MYSTENKIVTKRTAKAQAILETTTKLIECLRNNSCPKGNALEVARTAGIMATKRTWDLIPHCHPLPIDYINIEFELNANAVRIESIVTSICKTGVEMEALVAAQFAAITLFDMLKPLGDKMVINSVQVLEKTGGRTAYREKIPEGFKAAVIVTSDGTAAGTRKDRSGQLILEYLQSFGIASPGYLIVADDEQQIIEALQHYCDQNYQLIITTGGTGLGPRDITATVTAAFVDSQVPGVMEAARAYGQQRTPYAMLSRGVAGVKKKTLIINCPGSSRGTTETMDAIFPAIFHGYYMMAGQGHGS